MASRPGAFRTLSSDTSERTCSPSGASGTKTSYVFGLRPSRMTLPATHWPATGPLSIFTSTGSPASGLFQGNREECTALSQPESRSCGRSPSAWRPEERPEGRSSSRSSCHLEPCLEGPSSASSCHLELRLEGASSSCHLELRLCGTSSSSSSSSCHLEPRLLEGGSSSSSRSLGAIGSHSKSPVSGPSPSAPAIPRPSASAPLVCW
mmetsp:Transcript_34278/g.97964  ORF Transcript_34278/g.97964 Transcript_34278/m.97964 type:complete len:207 (-) Transcript_34278:1445-2065(-)